MNLAFLFVAMSLAVAAPTTIGAMKWERRVILLSAPAAQDASLAEQRRVIVGWKARGEARDLSVVEIVGNKVGGATDSANMLRQKYRLPATSFAVILIGKDGSEKLRSPKPVSAAVLEETIDAMPMRQAGGR